MPFGSKKRKSYFGRTSQAKRRASARDAEETEQKEARLQDQRRRQAAARDAEEERLQDQLRRREKEVDEMAGATGQGGYFMEGDRIVRRTDCPALPKGWKREESIRKSGLASGTPDVLYISPTYRKFRTKAELARYLGDHVDLSAFDFRTGRLVTSLLRGNQRRHVATPAANRPHQPQLDLNRVIRPDTSLIPPIRQTASIFKQPVTVVRTQPTSKVKTDLKGGSREKPRQLFWEKRLAGLRAYTSEDTELNTAVLGPQFKGVGPGIDEAAVLQSVVTALHLNTSALVGQAASPALLDKNPVVHINADQPLLQALTVSEEDIRAQEQKVAQLRKKLESVIGGI